MNIRGIVIPKICEKELKIIVEETEALDDMIKNVLVAEE